MSTKEQPSILLVDDEEMARKYFRLAFAKDFDILTADSVDVALDLLHEHSARIGVLVTDQRMPGRHGVELLKLARSDWPGIVRILTTAYSDLDEAIAAVNRGEILRYITKPWDLNSLRAELRHAMEFYLLRRERDLLLNEKLSVRRHMQSGERLRDYLALSAGLHPLRHASHALAAWVLDSREAQSNGSMQSADMELWGLEIRQTTDLMRLNQRLQDLKQFTETGFPVDIDLGRALNLDPGLKVKASPVLMGKLLQGLKYLQADRGSRLFGTDFGISLEIDLPEPDFRDDSPLLEAYVIAWHHGGCLRAGDGRLVLELPTDPLSVNLVAPDGQWLESCYTRLEHGVLASAETRRLTGN